MASASGGAATAISEGFLNKFNDGVIIGAAYSQDCRSIEFACVEKIQDLQKLKGSKYAATDKKIFIDGQYQPVFKFAGDILKLNKHVLFFGLGCDIAALNAYLEHNKINTEKLFTADLICYGATLKEVHTSYINELEAKFNSHVVNFTVRFKEHGWTPFFIRAEFQDGQIFTTDFYKSDYGYAFAYFAQQKCFSCNARGNNHQANITIADYWGLNQNMPGWNSNGVSILLTRSQKGEELVNLINRDDFILSDADPEFAVEHNGAYFSIREKIKGYDLFIDALKNQGLHKAVIKHKIYTLPKRAIMFVLRLPKRILRKLLKIFGLYDFVKAILHYK